MQQQLAVGNEHGAGLAFDTLRIVRTGMRPGDVALDYTVQEAWLLLAMRDTAAAIRYLDLPLTSLSTLTTHLLEDVPVAAALGRALALRADLAAARGDAPTARRFAQQVITLWGDAPAPLDAIVRRMRMLMSNPPPTPSR
jgi:hypothetical protein